MNASQKALEIGSKFIGAYNIVSIQVRNQHDPHIRVEFERVLDHDVRKQIEQIALPFKVRFVDKPFPHKLVEK